jgi:hypothetical protein
MNIPTPLIAAALFVVTFIGTIVLLVSGNNVPPSLIGMNTLFAGAALGGAVPNVTLGDPKP